MSDKYIDQSVLRRGFLLHPGAARAIKTRIRTFPELWDRYRVDTILDLLFLADPLTHDTECLLESFSMVWKNYVHTVRPEGYSAGLGLFVDVQIALR